MIKVYSPEEVNQLSTPEIARNISRLGRVDFASAEFEQLDGRRAGDFGSEDSQIIDDLASRIDNSSERNEDPCYDLSVIYGLQRVAPSDIKDKLLNPDLLRATKDRTVGREALLRLLAYDGYTRVGDVFEQDDGSSDDVQLTIGATAALAYMYSDIRNRLDRTLYDRYQEIEGAIGSIWQLVPPRAYEASIEHAGNKPIPVHISVYRNLSLKHSTAAESVNPWWEELQSDLAAIDAAALRL